MNNSILISALVIISGLSGLQAQENSYQTDSITVYALGNRAFSLRTSRPDSALLLADEALQLAETIRDTQAQISLWRIKGVVHYGQQRMEEADDNFERSYRLARRIHFREARLLINLGNVEFYRKDFKKALERYQQALRLSERQDTVVWMDALNNIGSARSRMKQFREAIQAYRSSLALQLAINNRRAQLPTLLNLGDNYRKLNQTDEEVATFEKGLEIATSLQDSTWMATFYRYMGKAYANRASFIKSLEAWQHALSIYEARGDQLNIARTVHQIGALQQDNDNLEAAEQYYERALAIAIEQKNLRMQASALNSMGRNLLRQKQFEAAGNKLQQSISLRRQTGDLTTISYPYYNLGDSYEQTDQLDSAIFYLQTAYEIADSLDQYYLKSLVLTSLGKVARKRGDLDQAVDLFTEAVAVSKIESMRQEEMEATQALYEVFKQQNRPAAALAYLERHHELQDSLFNEESTRKIAQLEAQYAFEQEKKEIADQNLAEKRKLDEEIRQQRSLQSMLWSALILSLLSLFLLYRFLRFRKSAALEQERLSHQINLQKLNFEQKERVRLQEMDTFKSRFFANISHELRTPLTLILGPVHRILKREHLDRPLRTQLQLVRENAGFLLKRVNEILDLTKFDARQMQLQETPTPLYAFTKRLAANFESFAQQKQQQYLFDYRLDKDLNILLDQTKFSHVFNNFLANAIKYTPEAGRIIVALYEKKNTDPGRLVLEVQDNGIGIRKKDVPHLFNRFYQADQRENKAGGSGIGLALSKEVAEAMGADIRVESEWREGSTFYFEFPYREVMGVISEMVDLPSAERPVRLESILPAAGSALDLPRIMVVEDNQQLRDYLQLILSDSYRVTTARNGEDAIRKLTDWNGHLIISDVMMPKMDGFELLKKLKDSDEYRHIPVVMLTARSEMQDKLKALRIGVDDYLLKPFVEDELLSRVQNLLGNYQNRQRELPEQLPAKADVSAADLLWLEELETILRKEVSNPEFTFIQLESRLFISRSQLQRRIKKITGLTPNKYFREIKLQVARELLESGQVRTVNEVAHAVGFDTTKYFSKIYEMRYGKRPVEWL
ncbi:hybrid sensor histidine kinase/response regulator transcription factor [Flavilitoribacter nigricans]|uniref:histidine kinase n=1 Tax=Flavilitoribacter nigricans (strain ATCC 23147 / DSM 23189 / NBRC 102662 / NCIMB 1420 / SS-2) TaxID=1122177 RepID=A0A2D0NAC6_FLAN2|nr:tetratricopeptide repeat protein [Flavilitoribacter nigricans]PHN05471.1 hypothetical protein CRP01_15870 [Flavilitoribacter nigricans DSM 23189 = NBRC 102662]